MRLVAGEDRKDLGQACPLRQVAAQVSGQCSLMEAAAGRGLSLTEAVGLEGGVEGDGEVHGGFGLVQERGTGGY